jgi:hypothetical protein
MPRHALGSFFERLVVATLPMCACGGTAPSQTKTMMNPRPADMAAPAGTVGDMASVKQGPGDLGSRPADMVVTHDLYGIVDPCDHNPDPPSVNVLVTKKDVPDAGLTPLCQSGAWCTQHCPSLYYSICCGPMAGDMGSIVLTCTPNCAGPNPGRRPAGLRQAAIGARCSVGRWLANAAHLEAASVHAFAVLGDELAGHGAPRALIAQARRARRDEARHARMMTRLARAHRAAPPAVDVPRARRRPLVDIAVENAAEGCVREAFAALLALWQSRAAADPEVRATMAALAPDEVRHAELAFAVDAWARPRLDRNERRRVDTARARAVVELRAAVNDPDPDLVRALGLPDAARAVALVDAVARELWR